MTLTREDAVSWDLSDPLASFRDEFHVPDGVVYMDGNSLGALPRKTPERLKAVVENEWGVDLIRSWNTHGWFQTPQRVGNQIAGIIGADDGEVLATDTTSINLFKLLAASLQLAPDRRVILSEEENFPTDLYIAHGLTELVGTHELRVVKRAELASAIDSDVAVVALTHVDFRSGEVHDMDAVTRRAHDVNASILWDLSHSAGALPVHLNDAGADFAVGCGYKYLNGGPGAPAYVFIAKRHQEKIDPPLSGWIGHEAPFAFDPDYRPAPGIGRQSCGTPSVLAMAALEVGVEIVSRADMSAVRAKSKRMGDLFIQLVDEQCDGLGLTIACPRDADARGSQVSLKHPDGYPLMQALIARGVIGDFRPPDNLRFGFTPLYLRFVDVWDAVAILKDTLESEAFRRPEFQNRLPVT